MPNDPYAPEISSLSEMREIKKEVKEMHAEFSKRNPILSIVISSLSSVIVTILVCLVIYGIFLKEKGKPIQHRIREVRNVSTRYGLIESRANYLLLLRKIKSVERGIVHKRRLYGIGMSDRKRMDDNEREDYAIQVYIGKVFYNIDEDFSLAITSSESEWNKKAKSSKGARGIWQVMAATFGWINTTKLDKFNNIDIYEVYHNSEAAIRYIAFLYSHLEHQIGRPPTETEVAWGYHAGQNCAIAAIKSKNPTNMLPKDTLEYTKKIQFYLDNYRQGNYYVWYYEQYYEPRTNIIEEKEEKTDANRKGHTGD